MLPNLLVIGAMKAGTTSLSRYLSQHPQVFMSRPKELNFFTIEHNWQRGVEWYERQFAEAGSQVLVIGEASTNYSKYPEYEGVPERIAKIVPKARLVYCIRDPIDRMCSHYLHRHSTGKERERLESALLRNPIYLNASRYALQIECYLAHFPSERLMIVRSEELLHAREATMQSICTFVGIDGSRQPRTLDREYYRAEDRRGFRRAALVIRGGPGVRALWRVAPAPIRRAGQSLSTRPVKREDARMSLDVRLRLETLLREDVSRLYSYLGDDFDGWGIA
jgi:Sulfotransferase domain